MMHSGMRPDMRHAAKCDGRWDLASLGKRNTVLLPSTVACMVMVSLIGALRLPHIPHTVHSSHLESETGGGEDVMLTHSLCGSLPLDVIHELIPADMVYFQRRWQHSKTDWALALTWLVKKHPKITSHVCDGHQQKLKLLLYYGAYIYMGLTGLNGTPQGEQIQWHDLYISLLLMGYHPTLVHTQRQLTVDYLDAYDLVITDYYGVNAAIDARSLSKHRCKLRLLDSWGTDAGPNERNGHGFCCLKVPSLSQFWTFTPKHSPDNSFLGYRVDSFRQVQVFESNATPVRKLEVLLYGKEYKFFTEDLTYINQLSKYAPTHATAMDVPSNALPDVMNHGVLAPNGLHKLMQETFAYAGFGAVMMGPAAIEALSNGMIFLNYAFCPPRNLSVTQGKPTTQLWTSQFPFLEHEGPHAITINTHNASDVKGKLQQLRQTYQEWWVQGQYRPLRTEAIMGEYVFLGLTHGHRSGYVPYEYTTVAMLLRVNNLVRADVCE